MLPGTFTAGPVTTYRTRVTINGVDRPAVHVDLDAQMRSDLPSQMTRHSGSMDRSGTIQWATAEDITQRQVTPFNDFGVWRPQRGDRVVVYQGDSIDEWVRFTGVVDETTGSVGTGMRSTVIADTDSLSEPFSCEPLLARMYPVAGSTTWRWAGLSPMFFVDAALRAGGYTTTEPTKANSALHVPLQSSMFPAVGTSATILSGNSHTGGSNVAEFWTATWGFTASNFRATYQPAESRPPSSAVDISVMVASNHFGTAYVDVFYGTTRIRLMVHNNRSVTVRRENSTGWADACTLSSAQMAGATRVEVLVKNGHAVLRNNTGAMAAGSLTGLGSTAMSRIEVTAGPDSRIASVQVSYPTTAHEFRYLNHTGNAIIRLHAGNTLTWGYTSASPRFEPTQAINVLETLAEQTLSAMWVDEYGTIVFSPSAGLRGQAPVQTITTADDVLALAWSDRLLAVASRVTVEYLQRFVTLGSKQNVTVAEGSRHELASGDLTEDIYKPSGDEDWYGVDANPRRLPAWNQLNNSSGSFVGVTYYQGGDAAPGNVTGATTNITMTRTGVSEWLVTHEAVSYPGGVTAETRTHPDSDQLWERNQGRALPIIRAWGRMEWSEQEVTRTTGLPGPILRVDHGAQAVREQAEETRDYLYGLVMNAVPQITDLDVTPDPRRQLGDVITIQSQNYLGVSLRCLVVGIRESMSADGAEQSLSLDVLEVTPGALTWQQWEQAFPGTLTYTQWQNLRDATDTYTDFNTDPLKGVH